MFISLLLLFLGDSFYTRFEHQKSRLNDWEKFLIMYKVKHVPLWGGVVVAVVLVLALLVEAKPKEPINALLSANKPPIERLAWPELAGNGCWEAWCWISLEGDGAADLSSKATGLYGESWLPPTWAVGCRRGGDCCTWNCFKGSGGIGDVGGRSPGCCGGAGLADLTGSKHAGKLFDVSALVLLESFTFGHNIN